MVEMGLQTVVYVILALLSVALLISLIPSITEGANRQYCEAYRQGTTLTDEPIPEECLKYLSEQGLETVTLSGDSDEVAEQIVMYMTACAKLKSKVCYTLEIKEIDKEITRQDISDVFIVRHIGGISWHIPQSTKFENNTLISIGYDSATENVVVTE